MYVIVTYSQSCITITYSCNSDSVNVQFSYRGRNFAKIIFKSQNTVLGSSLSPYKPVLFGTD